MPDVRIAVPDTGSDDVRVALGGDPAVSYPIKDGTITVPGHLAERVAVAVTGSSIDPDDWDAYLASAAPPVTVTAVRPLALSTPEPATDPDLVSVAKATAGTVVFSDGRSETWPEDGAVVEIDRRYVDALKSLDGFKINDTVAKTRKGRATRSEASASEGSAAGSGPAADTTKE